MSAGRYHRLLVLLLLILVLPAQAATDYVVIHAGMLLAVPGTEPQAAQSVVIQDQRIVAIYAGYVDRATLAIAAAETIDFIDLRQQFVMPGLMDAHTHLMWSGGDLPPKKQENLNRQDLTLWTMRSARTTLAAGFTTVRDLSSDPFVLFAVRDWINARKYLGPRILVAGTPIGALGGHGDMNKPDIDPADLLATGACDGLESCRRAVRMQHKLGSDVIKMMATGGFFDKTGTEQLFFFDEMEATVQAAHQLGLSVATHAYASDAIADAVRAGVDSIDHGFGASDDSLRQMKKQNIFLVPTLSIAQRSGKPSTEYRIKYQAFERALKIGTPIAFGSDVGGIPHRFTAREFRHMVAAGMSPAAAIQSATVNTAELFGLADEIGTLEPGKLADIIAVDESPLENIRALEAVGFVMKGGVIAKQAGEITDFFLD
jgi:imidazolonepropionase-like amidohydrolase